VKGVKSAKGEKVGRKMRRGLGLGVREGKRADLGGRGEEFRREGENTKEIGE